METQFSEKKNRIKLRVTTSTGLNLLCTANKSQKIKELLPYILKLYQEVKQDQGMNDEFTIVSHPYIKFIRKEEFLIAPSELVGDIFDDNDEVFCEICNQNNFNGPKKQSKELKRQKSIKKQKEVKEQQRVVKTKKIKKQKFKDNQNKMKQNLYEQNQQRYNHNEEQQNNLKNLNKKIKKKKNQFNDSQIKEKIEISYEKTPKKVEADPSTVTPLLPTQQIQKFRLMMKKSSAVDPKTK